jgi:hypothetical protein
MGRSEEAESNIISDSRRSVWLSLELFGLVLNAESNWPLCPRRTVTTRELKGPLGLLAQEKWRLFFGSVGYGCFLDREELAPTCDLSLGRRDNWPFL